MRGEKTNNPQIVYDIEKHKRIINMVYLPLDKKSLAPVDVMLVNPNTFLLIHITAKVDIQAERSAINLKIAKRLNMLYRFSENKTMGVRAPDAALIGYAELCVYLPAVFDFKHVRIDCRVENATFRKEDVVLGQDFLKAFNFNFHASEDSKGIKLNYISNERLN